MSYEGRTYQAPSGQWAWVITEGGEDVVRGAGYASEDEALHAMYDQLAEYPAFLDDEGPSDDLPTRITLPRC